MLCSINTFKFAKFHLFVSFVGFEILTVLFWFRFIIVLWHNILVCLIVYVYLLLQSICIFCFFCFISFCSNDFVSIAVDLWVLWQAIDAEILFDEIEMGLWLGQDSWTLLNTNSRFVIYWIVNCNGIFYGFNIVSRCLHANSLRFARNSQWSEKSLSSHRRSARKWIRTSSIIGDNVEEF